MHSVLFCCEPINKKGNVKEEGQGEEEGSVPDAKPVELPDGLRLGSFGRGRGSEEGGRTSSRRRRSDIGLGRGFAGCSISHVDTTACLWLLKRREGGGRRLESGMVGLVGRHPVFPAGAQLRETLVREIIWIAGAKRASGTGQQCLE